MSHESAYKSHYTTVTSTASIDALLGTVGALFVVTVVAVIGMVLIATLLLKRKNANW